MLKSADYMKITKKQKLIYGVFDVLKAMAKKNIMFQPREKPKRGLMA